MCDSDGGGPVPNHNTQCLIAEFGFIITLLKISELGDFVMGLLLIYPNTLAEVKPTFVETYAHALSRFSTWIKIYPFHPTLSSVKTRSGKVAWDGALPTYSSNKIHNENS